MSAVQERAAIVAWMRGDADRCELEAPSILAKLFGPPDFVARETEAWADMVAAKRGIANAIERGDHTPQAHDAQTVEGGSHDRS